MSGVITVDYVYLPLRDGCRNPAKRIRIPRDEIRLWTYEAGMSAYSVMLQWNVSKQLWIDHGNMTSEQVEQFHDDLFSSVDTDVTWTKLSAYGDGKDPALDVFTWTRTEQRP